MNKLNQFIIVGLLTLSLTNCSGQDSKSNKCIVSQNDLESRNIKGKVQSIRTQCYKAVLIDNKIENGGKKDYSFMDDNSFMKFNNSGTLIEALYYNDTTSQLERKEVVELNSNGCPKTIKVYTKGKLDWGEVIEYDYNTSEIISRRTDDKGQIVSSPTKFKMGKYGAEEETYLSKDGKVKKKTKNFYNSHGERYLSLIYDGEGKLIDSDSVKYDYNINSVTTFFIGDSTTTTEIRNADNLRIERYSISKRYTFSNTYSYEYDKVGNWIRMIEFESGKPKYITERTIKYY